MNQELNGSGIVYPTIELGGKKYVIKFTRGGMLYRMSRSGVDFGDLVGPKSFSATIDVLHAALYGQFSGTAEELSELVWSEEKFAAVAQAVMEALGKVFPPTQTKAAGTAADTAAPAQLQ